ncbi:MAG: repeat-containing protein [Nevskia sp.]|nr:repeat-containing protein [Nevskia sp.]
MSSRFEVPRLTASSALAACIMLTACGGGGGSGGSDAATPPPATSASLGLMRITISGIGGGQMTSNAEMLSGTSGPQAHVALPTAMPAGLDVQQVSASTVDVGTRGAGGERYFTVAYQVRNAQFCNPAGTCAPYTTASHNLTLLAADVPGNIAGTAISNISLYDGSSTADTQALAPSLLPTHGMQFNTGTGAGVMVQPGLESLQVFTEGEVAAITLDPGATGLFPYGYVVSNVNTAASRALPASPANNQWDGEVSFSFKLPLQATAKQDPYSITMIFQVIDDANTRVTESAEEQTIAGDVAASLRAATLGSIDLAVLGGRVAQTNIGDPVCTVRTAGAAAAPTATLVNNAGISVASAPYSIANVSPAAPVNVGFCAPMNAASFASFVVSGSQSGPRSAAGLYSGAYSANALDNILSFTPAKPFLPGETVNYTLTTGLGGGGGGTLPQAFNGSYVVGGIVPSSATFVQGSPITGGGTPDGLAVGDFNGDGKLDFAIVWDNNEAVQAQLNNGDGTFTAGPLIGLPGIPQGAATADFDGDGHLDLVVTTQIPGTATFLLNDGSGGFSVASVVAVGGGAISLAVGDFNGDGHPDVAVANSNDNTVSILINDGSGHFTTKATLPVGGGDTSPKVADFNGDGTLDLALALPYDGAVQLLLNDGHGNFTVGPEHPIGGYALALAAGDLNGDGIPDLVVSNLNTNPGVVMPLYGDGKGGFTDGPSLVVGKTPIAIFIGDLNGDGHADLMVANQSEPGTISILLNDGKGGFPSVSTMAAGSDIFAATAGDFNGDGRLDLLVTNTDDDNVTIFTGQP